MLELSEQITQKLSSIAKNNTKNNNPENESNSDSSSSSTANAYEDYELYIKDKKILTKSSRHGENEMRIDTFFAKHSKWAKPYYGCCFLIPA
jgi:hypothetical protein